MKRIKSKFYWYRQNLKKKLYLLISNQQLKKTDKQLQNKRTCR